DRIGMADNSGTRPRRRGALSFAPANILAEPSGTGAEAAATDTAAEPSAEPAPTARADDAALRAARIWAQAHSAPADHPYLTAKQVAPLGLRCDARGHLVVPLQDVEGQIHSLETIAPDGPKRFLAGGAKRGHFAVIGANPAPIAEPTGPILICEGWATGASLAMATGHAVIAAMDAGNLLPVAEALRARFPNADFVLVADNDVKPDRDTNPGVEAARKAVAAVDARIAVPQLPGDANDLFCVAGSDAVAALVAGAAKIPPPPPPTYPEPILMPDEARVTLADAIARFMAAVPDYWASVEAAREAAKDEAENHDPLDFNLVARAALPPLLGLPVDVGLGKTSRARAAIAALLASGGLGARKVVYAVPRHDLGAEQVAELKALGLSAMLWKGRTAPDPAPGKPEQLMCLDAQATFDALEIELPSNRAAARSNGAARSISVRSSTSAATSGRNRRRRQRRSWSAPMTACST
ncbi:MAG: toprim domain-containing protein, partial [Burkholderiaceae bacterium]|nr:toprim domain-containing protein [Burkholderiaceae bacterium]